MGAADKLGRIIEHLSTSSADIDELHKGAIIAAVQDGRVRGHPSPASAHIKKLEKGAIRAVDKGRRV